MSERTPISSLIRDVYRREGRHVFATLVRLLGSFDLAEEALQTAFVAAAERWPREGVPRNPGAWLVSAGRFRMIDQLRRQRRMTPWSEAAEQISAIEDLAMPPGEGETVEDDRLRLIFTCCHPSLSEEACIALTLREVCGLSTEAIAQACLLAPTTLAQRIVRAKAKIRDAGIPYEVPESHEFPQRLNNVLRVIYLVFNEGYSASGGDDLLKRTCRRKRSALRGSCPGCCQSRRSRVCRRCSCFRMRADWPESRQMAISSLLKSRIAACGTMRP